MSVTRISLKNHNQFQDLDLVFTYPKNHINAGQPLSKICFIGPNGVGKSTIMEFVMKYLSSKKTDNSVEITKLPEKIFYIPDMLAYTPNFETKGVEVIKIGEEACNLIQLVEEMDLKYTQSYKLYREFSDLPRPQDFIGPMFDWFISQMPNLDFSYAHFKNNQIYFKIKSSGQFISMDKLSSGTRQLMAKLLPLYRQKPNNSLIFIDQPEDALFPDLQKQIIKLYDSVGQNNQLFVATHSPLIASQFEPCEIFALDFRDNKIIIKNRPSGSQGWSSDKFLYHWFGVKSESEIYLALRKRFFELLNLPNHTELELQELKKLKADPILQDLF